MNILIYILFVLLLILVFIAVFTNKERYYVFSAITFFMFIIIKGIQ